MGGGNSSYSRAPQSLPGLSPRGRGKRLDVKVGYIRGGSIPAWAGETFVRVAACAVFRVYPRVGGGNRSASKCASTASGLSPRGRGKPPVGIRIRPQTRSIPAWAGETSTSAWGGALNPVYPRVGGGNRAHSSAMGSRNGLSPRGRGKPYNTLHYV